MKKIISIFLAMVMAFSMVMPAFAEKKDEHNPAECENIPVIVVRGMDFGGLYTDVGTENQAPAINVNAGNIVKSVFKAIFTGVTRFSIDATMEVVLDCVADIFKGLQIDDKGYSPYNTGTIEYLESAGNYENLCEGIPSEFGMVHACIDEFGGDHTYYFNYDWRIDPFVISDKINAMIEDICETTGHDKVNLACASLGGVMTVAYITEYGYERLNKCLFMSSAFCGSQVASDLLSGQISITADNLYTFLADLLKDSGIGKFAMKALYKIGAFGLAEKISDWVLENYEDEAYEKVLFPVFGCVLPMWGMVQAEDYDAAVKYIFGGKEDKYAEFIQKTADLQTMMAGRTELIQNMIDDGVGVAIVAAYDSPCAPVYKNCDFNGDAVLETYQMSGYATVAKFGETLGDDYVAKNSALLSPDRVVDLSTALFPEHTYIIKGAPHVAASYGTDYSEFFIWLLSEKGDIRAGANEKYPQFMLSGDDESLKAFD